MTPKEREVMQMALDSLKRWPLDTEENSEAVTKAIEALRASLAAPPEELDLPKVRLWEFLKLIEGKEDFRGIPMMRTEWPTQGEALAQPENLCIACEGNPTEKNNPCAVCGLAQPKQKPVAWVYEDELKEDDGYAICETEPQTDPGWIPLYTAPPQREWQGLTDDEYESMAEKYVTDYFFDTLKYARAIETKLRVKNGNL